MTPLEDAQEFVLGSCPPRAAVTMRRQDANGLVLAAPVVSGEIVPPFDNTAVDGYAVRSVDVSTAADEPVEMVVAGEIAAGAAPDRPVGPGEVIRTMTGAPMPDGADAVVCRVLHVGGVVAQVEEAAMHGRVERLDAAVHHFGEAGEVGDVFDGEARILQRFLDRRVALDRIRVIQPAPVDG